MGTVPILVFSFLSLLMHSQCADEWRCHPGCTGFHCGKLGQLRAPFSNRTHSECGFFVIDGCNGKNPKIQLDKRSRKWYDVKDISQAGTIQIFDGELDQHLKTSSCETFNNFTLPISSSYELRVDPNITLFKCNHSPGRTPPRTDFNYTKCDGYGIYFNRPGNPLPLLPPNCTVIQLPAGATPANPENGPFRVIASTFFIQPDISRECVKCITRGGFCIDDSKGKFECGGLRSKAHRRRRRKLWMAIGGSAIAVIAICSILYILRRLYRRMYAPSNFFSVKSSSKSTLERDSAYFGVPVFAYGELEEATNFFDSAKELGDGGFGTVYHGQLRDGREVAVKRLYENNYKRVEQFLNEIKILTRLRHRHLVTLYGCTSHHSRELLLVYEYIPNGTVSGHLHDDHRTPSLLTWPIRLRIAIETASALAYLHASGIIHRDVKTDNILLDNNFCVKVADFGLSRLFPTDATHISTAPQGTPGYLDPEYHQCYQLTEKSDVYSFGVVLIELVSSLPAVDIGRDRDEINLSNLAVNRIRNGAFHHLVDPCLGFKSDFEVRRMTILVAELAFLCVQPDREKRPSMEEVVRILKNIRGGGDEVEKMGEGEDKIAPLRASPKSEEGTVLLKGTQLLSSPTSVADKWVSRSTTPNISV